MNKKHIYIAVILLLITGVTIYAAVLPKVSLDNSKFETGSIKINLNDGEPVIKESNVLFEPGVTLEREFFVENNSSIPVYYRFYFDDNDGELAKSINVKIKDKKTNNIVYDDVMSNLVRGKVKAVDDSLEIDEKREFVIYFNYLSNSDNSGQDKVLDFEFKAEATQAKNNPDRLFNE